MVDLMVASSAVNLVGKRVVPRGQWLVETKAA